ncbi:hypothetical protein, partial [Rhodanobacter sp. FW104-R8]|uniref:hypothetical protein n=1 Tax=Rhodanobacter sp. FW104-R8 TaxID=1524464 RepID=UPI001F35BD77
MDADLFDKFVGQHLGEQSLVRRAATCRVVAKPKVLAMRSEQRIRAPGSTPLTRTLLRRPIMVKKECHVQA